MKMFQCSVRVTATLTTSMLLVSLAEAQLPSVNLNQSASSAASTTQRVRAQVQQRVQTQVQQQVQAQTQQRIQSQTRLRLPVTNSIRINADAGAKVRVDAGAGARLGAASGQSENGQTARGGIGIGIPVTVSAEEMASLDVVFGDFNPFRRPNRDETTADSEPAPESPSDDGETASDETPASESDDETDSGESRRRRPIRLVFQSEAEFQASLTAAVRQRRADISAMRDRAVAEADARMMAQADRMESMMDAYVAAEAKANANANSAINTSPFTRKRDSAVIRAGAESEVQGRAKVTVPGRRPAPEDTNPQPE